MPNYVETKADFDAILKDNALVVVDFTASWCGPCKFIGPKFDEMESKYTNVKFIKVDVDENEETSAAVGISAMPTFFFYKNGEKVGEVVGASAEKLEQLISSNSS